ncbi:hypothetical protein GW17_00008810 [Ensete ventricosum]|nr:hypothetical protein GW17_00008810 [Ensete ventricosum]
MRARLVVFPIKGRSWCFSRSAESASGADSSSTPPPRLRDLWRRISSHGRSVQESAEIVGDFIADKMNRAWTGLEKAPAGTLKSRIHSLGLRLLSRVKPSEIFLKSVTKDITTVEITYPAKYVLPLPNIPFFWILFRTYSHWRALKGSERLMLLVSDSSKSRSLLIDNKKESDLKADLKNSCEDSLPPPWILQPSEDLERLLNGESIKDGISRSTICSICKTYDLDKNVVVKYRNLR